MVPNSLWAKQFNRSYIHGCTHVSDLIPVHTIHLSYLTLSSRICWPFQADQGTNAASFSSESDIGYELFEVRTGPGLLPVHRLGRAPTGTIEAIRAEAVATLDKAFGEDGKRKRANIEKMREKISNVWSPGGSCTRELQGLADTISV